VARHTAALAYVKRLLLRAQQAALHLQFLFPNSNANSAGVVTSMLWPVSFRSKLKQLECFAG
jgi:hypothetical protein